MNHDSAPEVTAAGGLFRLIQRYVRWKHFLAWQYGTCRGNQARRNRGTGAVQFVCWPKGYIVDRSAIKEPPYVYAGDWWHDYDPRWWKEFVPNPRTLSGSDKKDGGK